MASTTHGSSRSVSRSSARSTSKPKDASAASADPVVAVQKAEGQIPAGQVLQPSERREKRALYRRSSPAQINLVLAEAAKSGGVVGGVAIDVDSARADQLKAAHLRVGVASANLISARLGDEALTLDAGVAQRVLAAVGALESQSRTPEGAGLVDKVTLFRGAATKRVRKSRAKPKAAAVTAAPAAAAEPTGGGATAAKVGG